VVSDQLHFSAALLPGKELMITIAQGKGKPESCLNNTERQKFLALLGHDSSSVLQPTASHYTDSDTAALKKYLLYV
jgi:hypothetical protein